MNPNRKSTRHNLARVRELLAEQDYDRYALAPKIGLSASRANAYLVFLEGQAEAHVAAWAPDSRGRMSIAVYRLGPGKRAPVPKGQSAREKAALYWKKLYADPARHAQYLARRRKPVVRPPAYVNDPLLAAFYPQRGVGVW